jgi:hypothetical protein
LKVKSCAVIMQHFRCSQFAVERSARGCCRQRGALEIKKSDTAEQAALTVPKADGLHYDRSVSQLAAGGVRVFAMKERVHQRV